MSSDPMADFLATLNQQLGTIPGPGQATPENSPLPFMHALKEHAETQQAAVSPAQQGGQQTATDQQQPQQPSDMTLPTTDMTGKQPSDMTLPSLDVSGQSDKAKAKAKAKSKDVTLAPLKFNLSGGHSVEIPQGSKAHEDMLKHLKNITSKPSADASPAPAAKKPDFMEQLADAITKRA